jgi:FkbM family methyltransferase
MKYSIVIPTFCHCDDLLKPCIESIIKHTNMNDIELIISANGCTDNTKEYLVELSEIFTEMGIPGNLKTIWSDEPTGYSKATNEGIKIATTDKIILLNNDVIILGQEKNEWIDRLNYQFEIDEKCGISGPSKIFSPEANREFIIFFCAMIDRKVFDTIGLLNEEYGKGGGEDTEMCILAEDAGFHLNACCYKEWSHEANMYITNYPLYHKGEGTVHDINLVPDWNDVFERNGLLLAKKFNPKLYEEKMSKMVVDSPNEKVKVIEKLNKIHSNMKYSIVIPTYNHCNDLLKPCIDSLLKYTDMNNVELIISANGCYDETSAYLDELKKSFIDVGIGDNLLIHWSEEATGYSKATNDGIRLATSDKIILLNNDVILLKQPKSDWIEKLLYQFKIDDKCGISGPLKTFSDPSNRWFIIFFCVMIDRKVFDTIGLLNEEYGKGGGEDTEMCILAEDSGFHVNKCAQETYEGQFYTGDFPIYHVGEGTMHDKNLVPDWDDVFIRNAVLLSEKFNPGWDYKTFFGLSEKSDDLSWLKENHKDAYEEIVVNNTYGINSEILENKNVIDIGANIGAFSIVSAHFGAKKILAIEPVQNTFKLLSDNIKKSQFNNIVPLKYAVSKKSGEYIIISSDKESVANSVFNINGEAETVKTITLRDLISKFDNNYQIFLKLDCEGSEYDIILNASQTEMNKIDAIALEIHSEMHPIYKGAEIINEKLKQFGFEVIKNEQLYSCDLDANGNVFNYKLCPHIIQIWKKREIKAVDSLNWLKQNYSNMYREIIMDNAYNIDEKIVNKNVLDIGANIGAFSLLTAFYRAKKVVSVEPVSRTFNHLVDNITKSCFEQIKPINKAVTNRSGDFVDISINLDCAFDSLYSTSNINTYESIETITLHDLIKEFDDDPIYLKIDCEGAEYDIILSASLEDMNRIEEIKLEIHQENHPVYKGVEIIENKLRNFGFHLVNNFPQAAWSENEKGEIFDYKEIPFTVQFWKK